MKWISFALLGSFLLFPLFSQQAGAVEVLVKPDTISISGMSFIEKDATGVMTAAYAGAAGTCASPTGTNTCDSCTNDPGSLQACNQSSVYAALPMTVSFRTTKDVTTSARGRVSILNSSNTELFGRDIPTQTYTANTNLATATLTWAEICNALGATATCSGGVYTGKLGFGVDSDSNNTIENTEMKILDLRLHIIGSGDPSTSNSYCTSAATTAGACSLKFLAGDEKVYIDSDPLVGATDVSNVDFDAIAIFPIPVASAAADLTSIAAFKPSVRSPIILPMSITSGEVNSEVNIPNSAVSGGLQNYQRYCFVYGTRNKAQNIYHFVVVSADSTLADNICLAPSEVVGLLADKHCFISTAAFGSDMASEVQIFRNFRNQFLLTNKFGKLFVKIYYEFSPPLAEIISTSEVLRAFTRAALYPALAFSWMALNYGLLVALFVLMVAMILIIKIKSVVKQKRLLLFLFVLMLTPMLKAQIIPKTKVIQHPEASEGLVRITKDGTYIYDLKREMRSESSRISFGHAVQPDVTIEVEKRDPTTGNGTGEFQTYDFGYLYEETQSLIIGYDYERFPWVGKQGKLGFQLGGALMFAQGHGIIVAQAGNADETKVKSQEKYTFFTLPLMAGAVYRLEWKDKQLFAPYVAGGGTYTALIEKREDKSSPQYTGAPGFYATGGVLFNVSQLDEDNGFALDNEYGISNLWVSLEYKAIEVESDVFTFSNRYMNLGVSFDF